MSIYGKGLLGAIIGGAVTGAVARFLAAGEWTWPVALRHVGYAGFSSFATVLAIEFYAPLAALSLVAVAALSAALVPVVARTLVIITTAAFSAKFGGFEINTGKEKNNDNDQ